MKQLLHPLESDAYDGLQREHLINFSEWLTCDYVKYWNPNRIQTLLDHYTSKGEPDGIEIIRKMIGEDVDICKDMKQICEQMGITRKMVEKQKRKLESGNLENQHDTILWYYGILQKMVALGYDRRRLTEKYPLDV